MTLCNRLYSTFESTAADVVAYLLSGGVMSPHGTDQFFYLYEVQLRVLLKAESMVCSLQVLFCSRYINTVKLVLFLQEQFLFT